MIEGKGLNVPVLYAVGSKHMSGEARKKLQMLQSLHFTAERKIQFKAHQHKHILQPHGLSLAEEVWGTFPACYTEQKKEFIMPFIKTWELPNSIPANTDLFT